MKYNLTGYQDVYPVDIKMKYVSLLPDGYLTRIWRISFSIEIDLPYISD